MVGTFWAFVPAIVAIVLALITKQVYVSLFVGIFVGAMFLTSGNPINALGALFQEMSNKVGANVPIIVFLRDICNLATKSALLWAYFASLIFAPMLVPLRSS